MSSSRSRYRRIDAVSIRRLGINKAIQFRMVDRCQISSDAEWLMFAARLHRQYREWYGMVPGKTEHWFETEHAKK